MMISPSGIDFASKHLISEFIQDSSSSRKTDTSSIYRKEKKTPEKNHFKKRVLSIDGQSSTKKRSEKRYLNVDSLNGIGGEDLVPANPSIMSVKHSARKSEAVRFPSIQPADKQMFTSDVLSVTSRLSKVSRMSEMLSHRSRTIMQPDVLSHRSKNADHAFSPRQSDILSQRSKILDPQSFMDQTKKDQKSI